MTLDHERILELLAGYAVRSLSGEDAAEADRLLSEHVPSCASCRESLADFQALSGELALAPPSRMPPDLLLPRLHRELEQRVVARRPRLFLVAAAAGVVAVLGMGALSVGLGIRASNGQAKTALFADALRTANRSDATKVPLISSTGSRGMTEVSAPGLEHVYLVGEAVPPPAPGMVYRVWFHSTEGWKWAGDFLPDPGITVLELAIPTRVDEIRITEEPEGARGNGPADTERWSATFLAA